MTQNNFLKKIYSLFQGRFLTPVVTALMVLLIAVNLFYSQDRQQVAEWDEARHIVSAVEMLRSGNFTVTTYNDEPDYWNLKPPLSIWGAAIGLYLGPFTPFSARMFSLLAAMATAALLYRAARYMGANALQACLPPTILLTTPSFILQHGARTADPDMLFIFLVTAGMLCFMLPRKRMLALGYLLLGLSFLCKSFHAAPFAIAATLYTFILWRKKIISFHALIFPPFAFLLPIIPWAILRYTYDGTLFFEKMLFQDVLKRGTEAIEGHASHVTYYIKFFCKNLLIFCLSIALAIHSTIKNKLKEETILFILWFIVPFLLYTLSVSKLYWYVFPTLPALSLILISIFNIQSKKIKYTFLFITIICIISNELYIIKKLYNLKEEKIIASIIKIANKPVNNIVYIENGVRQHYLATSLFYDNIKLMSSEHIHSANKNKKTILITKKGDIITY